MLGEKKANLECAADQLDREGYYESGQNVRDAIDEAESLEGINAKLLAACKESLARLREPLLTGEVLRSVERSLAAAIVDAEPTASASPAQASPEVPRPVPPEMMGLLLTPNPSERTPPPAPPR